MSLFDDRDRWSALVGAVQRGDASAWPALIDRFEDIAVASAVGLCGDLDEAPDIAQEAFVLAFRHLAGLQDAAAFPAWLLRLVPTATNRRTRPRHFVTGPPDPRPPAGPAAVTSSRCRSTRWPGTTGRPPWSTRRRGRKTSSSRRPRRRRSAPPSSACPRVSGAWSRCTISPACPTPRSPP